MLLIQYFDGVDSEAGEMEFKYFCQFSRIFCFNWSNCTGAPSGRFFPDGDFFLKGVSELIGQQDGHVSKPA